ncbi:MAG: methyltransferase [Gemmataceae bacterium]
MPACYAMVQPGLEEIAAEEIQRDLGGEIRKSFPGVVVFRVPAINPKLLNLLTCEDVFLLAWGTEDLTFRAEDLDFIQRWTAGKADWEHLLQIHHSIRPKPKGKPSFHLVTQMEGKRGYLRKHARESMAKGLAGHLPSSWNEVEENASVEIWLSIDGKNAVCGLRLSDKSMRHRTWKQEHRPASLRPTVAAAMVQAASIRPGQVVVDPMCGVGTILAEMRTYCRRFREQVVPALGGDLEFAAVRAAQINLRRIDPPDLFQWDARNLPICGNSVDCVLSNPPFGVQLSNPEEIPDLYKEMIKEYHRILKPGGRATLIVSEPRLLRDAVSSHAWKAERKIRLRVLGQSSEISVWRKP